MDHLSMRVIQVIAARDPQHAAGLLDVISNPALVASALRGEVLEADTLV